MSTKLEKIQATELNLKLAQSKFLTLETRNKEIELKINRLRAEQTALKSKAQNLRDQISKLQTYLNKQKS